MHETLTPKPQHPVHHHYLRHRNAAAIAGAYFLGMKKTPMNGEMLRSTRSHCKSSAKNGKNETTAILFHCIIDCSVKCNWKCDCLCLTCLPICFFFARVFASYTQTRWLVGFDYSSVPFCCVRCACRKSAKAIPRGTQRKIGIFAMVSDFLFPSSSPFHCKTFRFWSERTSHGTLLHMQLNLRFSFRRMRNTDAL